MSDTARITKSISECSDPEKLRTWIKNAQKQNDTGVADMAFRRLISIAPSEKPGTVEYDFWQMVHAFEYVLSEERGRSTRLSRTRQKVARVGEVQTLKDWALSDKITDGFEMLLDRGMPEFTGEAIVLRHPEEFDELVQAAARQKLVAAGVDVNRLV